MAAEGGREDVVEVLLHHKADYSLVTDTGQDHIITMSFGGECNFSAKPFDKTFS